MTGFPTVILLVPECAQLALKRRYRPLRVLGERSLELEL
jgi:hypothetical protein